MPSESIPFTILALAPFSTDTASVHGLAPIQVDKDNLPEVMKSFNTEAAIPLPKKLCPTGEIRIQFSKPKDFHPDGMILSNPFLENLSEAKKFLRQASGIAESEIQKGLEQFDGLPPIGIQTLEKKSKKKTDSSLDSLLGMVAFPDEEKQSRSTRTKSSDSVDSILKQVFEMIFAHEDFIRLDEAWRGVGFLLDRVGSQENVVVKIAAIDQQNPMESIEPLTANLFEDLPSIILVDLSLDNTARSLEIMEGLARLGETLLVPAIAAIGNKFFHLDSWKDFSKLAYLNNYLDDSQFAKWHRLRQIDSARWLAICCNGFLCRYPFGPDNPPRSSGFKEPRTPWTNPVWAIGALMAKSVEKFSWPTQFTSWQDIQLQDLALDSRDSQNPLPTQIFLSNDRVEQLHRIGIMPLVARKRSDTIFVPLETTLARESLSRQLLLSFVTQCIIRCQDTFPKTLDGENLKSALRENFSVFFQKGGREGLEDLEITTGSPNEENKIPVHILIIPARHVLASGRSIILDFLW